MSDNKSILEQLRQNNPFASSCSPMPFENTTPDIAQLNRDASEEIEQLIRQKRREPNVPLAGLIFGAAGIGKTHMMTRILRKLRKNSWSAIFVTIRAFTNPKRVLQELLSEVIICLTKPHSEGRTQFDVMVEGMINTYYENRKNDGFSNIEALDRKTYLRRDMTGIDRNFLKALLFYADCENEAEKYEIIEWLREGLDDEDSQRLGLPVRDVNSMDDAECESSAKNLLTSLGIVMAYSHIPMIICFDELDSIKDKELIEAWGDAVGFIINHLYGILPLCFVKSETWETFKPVLNPSMLQRLRNNTIVMNGTCSPSLARQIIHDKIAAAFSEGSEEKYQWLISRMENVLTPGLSPRMVIELANKALKTNVQPKDTMKEIYDEEYKKVQAESNAWPPNADHLTLALEVWLSSIEGFGLYASHGKYIRIQGVYGDRKFAFIIVIPKSHVTATNGVKDGLKFLNEYPGSYCCYVMEDKSHKKTWKKFAEKLNEFERAGGSVVHIDKDTRISWYALTALINRVENGDVNIYTQTSRITATRQDLLPFVSTLRLIDMPSFKLAAASVTYTPVSEPAKPRKFYDEEILAKTMTSIVTSSPMSIMNIDKASELLAQRGISLSRNEALSFIKKHRDRFRTFRSKNDILITVAGKS